MANNNNSVEKAEIILQNLKAEAKTAHDAEDVFLMGVLTELIAVASPIVTKAVARQHREERAKINAAHTHQLKGCPLHRTPTSQYPEEWDQEAIETYWDISYVYRCDSDQVLE
jgi:hypothetical protein